MHIDLAAGRMNEQSAAGDIAILDRLKLRFYGLDKASGQQARHGRLRGIEVTGTAEIGLSRLVRVCLGHWWTNRDKVNSGAGF
jgi:hypothetical protein